MEPFCLPFLPQELMCRLFLFPRTSSHHGPTLSDLSKFITHVDSSRLISFPNKWLHPHHFSVQLVLSPHLMLWFHFGREILPPFKCLIGKILNSNSTIRTVYTWAGFIPLWKGMRELVIVLCRLFLENIQKTLYTASNLLPSFSTCRLRCFFFPF